MIFKQKFKELKRKLLKESNTKNRSENLNIASRMPYLTDLGGATPLDYQLMEGIGYLPKVINEMTMEMLDKIQLDEYNDGSFLDEYIDLYIGLAKNDLKRQKTHHNHVIEGLKIIGTSRSVHAMKMQELVQDTLEKCQEEVEGSNQDEI